jgi:hypothetical protein
MFDSFWDQLPQTDMLSVSAEFFRRAASRIATAGSSVEYVQWCFEVLVPSRLASVEPCPTYNRDPLVLSP